MVNAVIALHITVCFAIVIVVLLQRGKGAEVGAVFGGSSQTVFGASGAGGALFKLTWTFAAVFFMTSLYLAYASTQHLSGSIFEGHNLLPKNSSASTSATPVLPATARPVIPAAPAAPAGLPK
ncbi:MAG: preprotein translocase subunit SecG [Candidatus Binataceae bacterium]|nr:preprotein translocase subunit SecG [Candidatus Binataceae bacterium]